MAPKIKSVLVPAPLVEVGSMSEAHRVETAGTDPEDLALEAALEEVPRGALALSGVTVGLLLLAWLLMYALVFLPRGMVS